MKHKDKSPIANEDSSFVAPFRTNVDSEQIFGTRWIVSGRRKRRALRRQGLLTTNPRFFDPGPIYRRLISRIPRSSLPQSSQTEIAGTLFGPLYFKSLSSVWLTRLGLAFPLEAFMTWPFRKLIAAAFPAR